jgi:hypothetical protein
MARCEMCDVHPVSVTTPAMMLKVGDKQKHHHAGFDRWVVLVILVLLIVADRH